MKLILDIRKNNIPKLLILIRKGILAERDYMDDLRTNRAMANKCNSRIDTGQMAINQIESRL